MLSTAKKQQAKIVPIDKNHSVPTFVPQARTKRKLKLRPCFLLVFMLWALYTYFVDQAPKFRQLEQEKAQLNQQMAEQEQKLQELNAEIKNLNNEEYIALLARKYNMVKKGEVVYQPGQ
jgi:cell division protein FtsL